MTPNTIVKVFRLSSVATLSLLTMVGCQESEQSVTTTDRIRPVKLYTITNDNQQFLRTFPAIVEPHQEANLSFRLAGELVRLPASEGAFVEKGDSLAVLDNRDALNELEARETEYDLAKSEFYRVERLLQKKMVSPSVFENAETRLKAAEVAVQQAKNNLIDTTLVAPFSGRIAQTLVDNFQSVEAQQLVVKLQDNSKLDITIQLPESLLAQLKEEEIDENYQPYVSFSENSHVAYSVTYKKHSTQVTPGTQSYEVTFSLPAPKEFIIYPGMTGTLTLDLHALKGKERRDEIFILPITSVQKEPANDDYRVWVFNSESQMLSPRLVTVSEITNHGVVVTGGVREGEQIVSAGLSRVKEGVLVKPLHRERGL
ncbi:efflux RND transporter periplasmic adaptor subunit [Vibrio sp. St2]|nr:efflux RND transporter periplasmic adaptor subunit [Vibrio sp. St2]QXL80205.1 Multidrug resistance protein MdtA [Vibrio sp.]